MGLDTINKKAIGTVTKVSLMVLLTTTNYTSNYH